MAEQAARTEAGLEERNGNHPVVEMRGIKKSFGAIQAVARTARQSPSSKPNKRADGMWPASSQERSSREK